MEFVSVEDFSVFHKYKTAVTPLQILKYKCTNCIPNPHPNPNRSGFPPSPGKEGRDCIACLPACTSRSESCPTASQSRKDPNVPLSYGSAGPAKSPPHSYGG
ncbi:hypothetical protein ATANTOWER_029013 [Ataeniobius toweri]|uniref:Uncharacterized protein n=1 Tax=Ataeniobius toweri TaxID=208326 RepID=A0ABU7B181_9TELE|nr:hypothetical protein [Ataeniobius toweri]